MDHIVRTHEDPDNPERGVWECSCGRGGSTSIDNVDLASDKHIGPDDQRIDQSGGEPW